ncbi:hypothetical protein QEH68_20405 [Paenarthrobacter sp. OM7]|uniref:hypothetical protein n=1 Tax=Paenarthrobacter sp. OM7 TaxID=3041264 RepID=UPI002468A449|nr:hypothetical protein [Paenarthrobacter sp. OM7]WGM20343.1 hypothetical protein QEH68_20405 [Paenarthrobacter sp. OM7]
MTHSLPTPPAVDLPTKAKVTRGSEQAPHHHSAAVALGAFSMAAVVGVFALLVHTLARQSPRIGPVYTGWSEAAAVSPMTALRWFLSDMTEPLFWASDLAALGLLSGAALAWWAGRRGKSWVGSLTYGTGLWPWVLASASLSLLLSNLAFGWMLDDGWQPTFVPFVCVAPAMVLLYGAGWKTCVTGAVLGAATTTPLALLFIPALSMPLGLPVVVANVLAMSVGSVLAFMVARRLPWLALHKPGRPPEPCRPPSGVHGTFRNDAAWAARRVLKDFTETHFFANELAAIGVILAVSAAFVLNPAFPSYGTHLLPQILFAQALTSAIGVVLWQRWYRDGGWAATYASVVSVAPAAVLAYGGSWSAVVGGAVLGAVLAPPLARVVSARLPAGFHPVIGNTAAMAVSTAVALPLLGLLPH